MMSASWFGKAKTTEAVAAKDSAADVPSGSTLVLEAASPSTEEPTSAEPAKMDMPPATEKPAPTAASGIRASRLVEAGRTGSTTLNARLTALLARAQPWGAPAAAAVALLAAGGLGYAGGYSTAGKGSSEDLAALRWSEASASIRENREDVTRLGSEMRFVRTALDSLRGDRRGGDAAAKQVQLIERSSAETSARIAKLTEQLERMEKTQRDPARLGAIVDRLERIEKQVQTASLPVAAASSAAKPVAAAPGHVGTDVTATGSLPADPRPPVRPAETVDPRKLPAEGYTLRDMEDGFALVEGRNGRYFEVSTGMNLPGLGRVESIERRGRQWVVVTPKGFIAER